MKNMTAKPESWLTTNTCGIMGKMKTFSYAICYTILDGILCLSYPPLQTK